MTDPRKPQRHTSADVSPTPSGDVGRWQGTFAEARRAAVGARPTIVAWLIPLTEDPRVHGSWISADTAYRESLALLAQSGSRLDRQKLQAAATRLTDAAADLRRAADLLDARRA